MRRNKPMLHDPNIIHRVKEYLEENVDKTYVDVSEMAKTLQIRYPEYMRRKNAPFRALVEKAYRIVSDSYASGSAPTSNDETGGDDDDSDGSDLEMMDSNIMNNMMNSLYAKRTATPTGVGGGGGVSAVTAAKASEAIDISSDEGDDEGTQNGFPTCAESGPNASGIRNPGDGGKWGSVIESNPNKRTVGTALTEIHENKKRKLTTEFEIAQQNLNRLQQQQQQQQNHIQQNLGQPPHQLYTGLPNKAVSSAMSQPQSLPRFASPFKPASNDSTTQFSNSFNYHQQQRQQHHQQLKSALQKQLTERSSSSAVAAANSGSAVSTARSAGVANQSGSVIRPRKYKKEVKIRKTNETFQDLGGMEKTLKELCEILMHIKSPDLYFVLGLMPPRGVLLHGPSGCGKTLLARAIAGQLNLPLIEIPATELIAGVSGESEERIRDVFEQAIALAPCVLFIDEIDAISSNRSTAQKDMERRVVSQLISCLDGLKVAESGQSVLVIGATTRPDILDPALRRVGRFDHEVAIGIPTRKDRKDILTILCDGLSVEDIDFDKLAELTPGYVGADLLALVSRAATIAVKRMCAIQLRAMQSQRNITIVDLDDDNDETDAGEKAVDANSTTNKEQAVDGESNGGKSVQQSPQSIDKAVDMATECGPIEAVEEAKKKSPVLDDAAVNEVDQADPNPTEVEEVSAETADSAETAEPVKTSEEVEHVAEAPAKSDVPEKMDVDAPADTKVLPKTIAHSSKTSDEVTLFEMLNWLENPPEDLNFVSEICIVFDDFLKAVKVVQPSAKREGFITVPGVTWDEVGSLQNIREQLKLAVLAPVKYPKNMERLGLTAPSGVLLCGPPGCGKTLLAKAIANEAGINFISVKGPELMNMYVGESERAVRACFQRARNSAPCVIFFDEFDSLCPKRSDKNEGSAGTRVVNQLLTEMDGVEERRGVYILAATNRPDIIDPAILRPGRLDTVLYVGLPDVGGRRDILKATTKNRTRPVLADDVDFDELAAVTDGYTGADLSGLVQQAAMMALKESLTKSTVPADDLCVRRDHFMNAIQALRPSVSVQDRKMYEALRLKYAAPPNEVAAPITKNYAATTANTT